MLNQAKLEGAIAIKVIPELGPILLINNFSVRIKISVASVFFQHPLTFTMKETLDKQTILFRIVTT